MGTATINFKADIEDKKRFKIFAETVGISISSLLNSFIKKNYSRTKVTVPYWCQ
jgi:antitoxin component of RelBE/YafQ-DinJ toxin-antitoxin module